MILEAACSWEIDLAKGSNVNILIWSVTVQSELSNVQHGFDVPALKFQYFFTLGAGYISFLF